MLNSTAFVAFFVAVFAAWASRTLRGRCAHGARPVSAGRLLLLLHVLEPVVISLIVFSTAVDFVAGQRIDAGRGPARRAWLVASLAANLGVLGVFVAGFFAESCGTCYTIGIEASPVVPSSSCRWGSPSTPSSR